MHTKLDREMVLRLAADDVIAGLKDSSGDEAGFRFVLLGKRDRALDTFAVFTGSELVVDSCSRWAPTVPYPGSATSTRAGYVRSTTTAGPATPRPPAANRSG